MLKEFDFGEARLRLQKGDRLLFYTDGAQEAEAPDEELYELDRLLKDLEAHRDRSPEDALEAIMQNLRTWCGSETMEDDVTFLILDTTGEEHSGS